MKYLMLFLIAVSIGCRPTTPDTGIPPIPPKPESSLQSFQKLDNNVGQLQAINAKLSSKIEEQKRVTEQQKNAIAEAITLTESIKKKVAANEKITEIETMNLLDELKKVKSYNMFLVDKNNELLAAKEESDASLVRVKEVLDKTHQQIIEIEKDSSLIRDRLTASNNALMNQQKELNKLRSDLISEKRKSASASVYKNWVIGIVVSFVLWTIIKNVLMMYFPASRFRI